MALMMNVTAALTGISSLLLAALLYVYYKNLRSIKSKFTIGLFIFALLFLTQNLVSLYFYIAMMDYFAAEVAAYVFILTVFQTIAFLVLLAITWD